MMYDSAKKMNKVSILAATIDDAIASFTVDDGKNSS